jgi:hypothetical protein
VSWAGHIELRNEYKIVVKNHKGKTSLGLLQGGWGDNIEMDLKVTGYEDLDCTNVTQDTDQRRALVNTLINVQVP